MRLDQHRIPQFRSFDTIEEEPQWHRPQDDAPAAEPAPAEEAPGALLRDMARYSPAIASPPPPPLEPQRQLPRLDDVRTPAAPEPQQRFEAEAQAGDQSPHDTAPAEAPVAEPAPAAPRYEVLPSEGEVATFLPDIFTRPDPSAVMNLQASAFDLLDQARAEDGATDNYATYRGEGNDWDDYTPAWAASSLPGYSSAPEPAPAAAPEPAPPADLSLAMLPPAPVEALAPAPAVATSFSGPSSLDPQSIHQYVSLLISQGVITHETGMNSVALSDHRPVFNSGVATPTALPGNDFIQGSNGDNKNLGRETADAGGDVAAPICAGPLLQGSMGSDTSGWSSVLPELTFGEEGRSVQGAADAPASQAIDSTSPPITAPEAGRVIATLPESSGDVAQITREVIEAPAATNLPGLSVDLPALAAAQTPTTQGAQQSIYSENYEPVPGTAGQEPAGGRDKLIAAPDLTPLPSEFTPTTLDGRAGRSEPYRDQEGKVFFRTFDADGKEVGLVSQADIGSRPDAVVVTGPRISDSADSALMTPVTDAFGMVTGHEQPLPTGGAPDPVLVQQVAGGFAGAMKSVAKGIDGAVRTAGNIVIQIGDILTLGVNHDDPFIQQAWIEQGALADSAMRLVTEPIATWNKVEANLAERSEKAEQLRSQGRHFDAAVVDGEMAADVSQAVLGVGGVLYSTARGIGAARSRAPVADSNSPASPNAAGGGGAAVANETGNVTPANTAATGSVEARPSPSDANTPVATVVDGQASSKAPPDVADAAQGGRVPGEYLEGFQVSKTPAELVLEQSGKPGVVADIRIDHILDGGVNTLKDGTVVGTGGHYLRSPDVRVTEWLGEADGNGVSQGYVSIRNPADGSWVPKSAPTTFYPESWTRRQVQLEIEGAFQNSSPITRDMWEGLSPSGVTIRGYYGKPNGTGATAWPVYEG